MLSVSAQSVFLREKTFKIDPVDAAKVQITSYTPILQECNQLNCILSIISVHDETGKTIQDQLNKAKGKKDKKKNKVPFVTLRGQVACSSLIPPIR